MAVTTIGLTFAIIVQYAFQVVVDSPKFCCGSDESPPVST
jgi:hypothetical protein